MALPSIMRSLMRSEAPSATRQAPFRRHAHPLRATHYPRLFSSSTPTWSSITITDNARDIITEARAPTSNTTEEAIEFDSEPLPLVEESSGSSATTKKTKEGKKPLKAGKGSEKEKKTPSDKKKSDKKSADKRTDKSADKAKKAPKKEKREVWHVQKEALQKKFPAGWNPPKKLSPDALEGIRHLHKTDPDRFNTAVLAEEFQVSPEAIRRILKSRWAPSGAEMEDRRERWERRHERIWSQKAELGLRPFTKRARPFSDAQLLYRDE